MRKLLPLNELHGATIVAVQIKRLVATLAVLAACLASVTAAGDDGTTLPRFSDYRFDFSLVDDTVIPGQPIWLRVAQTNITNHEIPKLVMTAGGPVFSVWLVDSTDTPLPVAMPHFDYAHLSKGTLQPGKIDVQYQSFGPDIWFFTSDSLRAALIGHTWGMAIRFSTYVFGEAELLRMKRPPLPLTVIEAIGPEAEAKALMRQGKCRELLQRFPHSRLVDEALRALHIGATPSEKLEIAREQIRLNPESPQLIRWAAEIKRELGVAAYNEFVGELARDHPRARALEVLKEEK
jgi:hypothetical protein